jgi:hypothetical protein
METKEQKIEKLKKLIEDINFYKKLTKDTFVLKGYAKQIKQAEQQLKEQE